MQDARDTSIDMSELPLYTMYILCYQLLTRWIHSVVLQQADIKRMLITKSNSLHLYFQMKSSREESLAACSRCEVYIFTSSGRHSSAALLGTENPPCVLVSLAVNVLQNELLFLSTAGGGSSATKGFSLCHKTRKE